MKKDWGKRWDACFQLGAQFSLWKQLSTCTTGTHRVVPIAWPSNCSIEDARIHHPANVTRPPGTEKHLCQNPVFVFNLCLIRLCCKDRWKSFLLGLNPTICHWILDFLTLRPQSIHVRENISHPISMSAVSPRSQERMVKAGTGRRSICLRAGAETTWCLLVIKSGKWLSSTSEDHNWCTPSAYSATRQTSGSWECRSFTIFSGQGTPSREENWGKLKQASFPIGSSPRSVEIMLIHANATMDKKAVQRVIRSAERVESVLSPVEDVFQSRCRNKTQRSDSPRNTPTAEDAPPVDATTTSCHKLSSYLILLLKSQHWTYITFISCTFFKKNVHIYRYWS